MKAAVVATVMSVCLTVAMFGSSFAKNRTITCFECFSLNDDDGGVQSLPNCVTLDEKKSSNFSIECGNSDDNCFTLVKNDTQGRLVKIVRGCVRLVDEIGCKELNEPHQSCTSCNTTLCNDVSYAV